MKNTQKTYELITAVFQVRDCHDAMHDGENLAVIQRVRLVAGASRGYAVSVAVKAIQNRYRTSDVKFAFWCDSWTSIGNDLEVVCEVEQFPVRAKSRLSATKLALATRDAYSVNRYRSWAAVITELQAQGYSDEAVAAIVRSKWTRWAADQVSGKASAADLIEWIKENQITDREVAQLMTN